VGERGKTLRNIAIIVGLALIVWLLPAGATAADVITNVLSVIFMAGLMFFGYRMYMEHRATLFDLEDRTRVLLYGSAYWKEIIDFAALVRHGVIAAADLELLTWVDDPETAFATLTRQLARIRCDEGIAFAPSRHARQTPQTSSGSTATRCPAASRPVVSSTTSPTSSWPTTTGGRTADISPCQRWRSVPQMPA